MITIDKRIACASVLALLLGCDNGVALDGKAHSGVERADGGKVADGGYDSDGGEAKKAGDAGTTTDEDGGDVIATRRTSASKSKMSKKAGAAGAAPADDKRKRAGAGGSTGDDDMGGAGAAEEAGADGAAKDAGAGADGEAGGDGAAGPSDNQNPLDVLWKLARQTPQGKNAEIIMRYLDALGSSNGMPASSVEDFLQSIDEEAHCSQMLSQECLAACQVVNATCAVCITDEGCRDELLQVCGLRALACGR